MTNRIEHLVFLIHPCLYESMSPEVVEEKDYRLYVEVEKIAKARWIQALELLPTSTLFIQLYGPKYLHSMIRKSMGKSHACYVQARYQGPNQQFEYYVRLTQKIKDHLNRFGLILEEDATTELWGESFEGCVSAYGSIFAQRLGLRVPPTLCFPMTVYDSRFLEGAEQVESLYVPNTDIEAMMFRCFDDTYAAIFQPRLTSQWSDVRQICLCLDPARVMACDLSCETVCPCPPDTDPFTFPVAKPLWIRTLGNDVGYLKELVQNAKIKFGPRDFHIGERSGMASMPASQIDTVIG